MGCGSGSGGSGGDSRAYERDRKAVRKFTTTQRPEG